MSSVVVVERVLAASATGAIFTAREPCGRSVRVKVSDAVAVTPGEFYSVTGREGNFVDKAGRAWRQIEATKITRECARGTLLGPWLARLPHLGPIRAQRLLDAFGADLLEVLSDPGKVESIASVLDPKRPALARRIAVAVILETAARQSEESFLVAEARFLQNLEEHGVTDRRAAKQLWRLLGSTDADRGLVRNPYLAASILNWNQADHLGRAILTRQPGGGDPLLHSERLIGAIDNVWRGVLAAGDTALSGPEMRRQLQKRSVNADAALAAGRNIAYLETSAGLFRAPGAAWIEDDLAKRLRQQASHSPLTAGKTSAQLAGVVEMAENSAGFRLTGEQRDAVTRLLGRSLGVLQGGAGVGKTAVTRVLCSAWEALGGTCVLTALSGKAALQLSRGASSDERPRVAYTAARLLRILKARSEMEREGADPPADWPKIDSGTLLIVDEASMVDAPTFRWLAEQMVSGSHLLFVGDHGQLPSVGIGKVFHDLVEDGSLVVSLSTVLRQASESLIPRIASAIREGDVPELEPFAGQSAGVFLATATEGGVRATWRCVYEELCSKLGQSHVMALASLNASVAWLNQEVAAARHRGASPNQLVRLGPFATVAAGDQVVCRLNRYGDALFNGMLGVVTAVDTRAQIWIHWDGEEEPRLLSASAASDIGLGFALTCHKSQGSSTSAVVVLVENSRLVTREWLYTAVTRARELVVLVGVHSDLAAGVDRRVRRTTGFSFAETSPRT